MVGCGVMPVPEGVIQQRPYIQMNAMVKANCVQQHAQLRLVGTLCACQQTGWPAGGWGWGWGGKGMWVIGQAVWV